MLIQLTENPGTNSYISSLIKAYQRAGHEVICGPDNFFHSNVIPDILHIQWPERLYKWYVMRKKLQTEHLDWIIERLNWYKENNSKIIHTIHNLIPHYNDGSFEDKRFYSCIIKHSDILVHHCPKSIDLLKEQYSEAGIKKNIIANHPDYLMDYKYIDKKTARQKLNIPQNAKVILSFGSQQRYKGGSFIEDVFRKINVSNKFLFIAGHFNYGQYSPVLRLFLQLRNKVRENNISSSKKFIYRSVPDDKIPLILHAADVMFLGHSSGLNSGVISLAATYSIPLVIPQIGCFEYQAKDWSYLSYKASSKKDAITSVTELLNNLENGKVIKDNKEFLKNNSWQFHTQTILDSLNNA